MSAATPSSPQETHAFESVGCNIDVAICIDNDAFTRLRPVIRHLCVGLVDLSARVRIITSSPESSALASLGPVEVLGHPEMIWPLRRRRVRKIVDMLSARRPNVVYAFASGRYQLGGWLAEALDNDLVVQVTSAGDVDALGLIPAGQARQVIAASKPLLVMLEQRARMRQEQLTVVRPGVLRGSGPTTFLDENRIPAMVCTSRLEPDSGLDMVIDASAIVRRHGQALLTFLVGSGGHEAALRKRVRDRAQSSYVTFARPSGDMAEVIRGADLFVLPPGEEAISARPLQAMANGTVVICFEGGVADFFHDGETAIVCKERTAKALAAAIERLLADHALARTIAANAVEYVKKRHQMSTMAELTMGVFKQVALSRATFKIGQ
ncbi:MAG: glycosyltransferase family 4 protein [Phycisphaerae bacterium]